MCITRGLHCYFKLTVLKMTVPDESSFLCHNVGIIRLGSIPFWAKTRVQQIYFGLVWLCSPYRLLDLTDFEGRRQLYTAYNSGHNCWNTSLNVGFTGLLGHKRLQNQPAKSTLEWRRRRNGQAFQQLWLRMQSSHNEKALPLSNVVNQK